MGSSEEYHHVNDTRYREAQYAAGSSYSTNQSYQNGATSRPAQQSRTSSEQNVHSRAHGGGPSQAKIPTSRSRTQSQPYRPEFTNGRLNNPKINGATPSSDTYSESISPASRSLSPPNHIKPSRIPQPTTRTRTASLSSNNYAPPPNGSTSPYSSPRTPDLKQASASDLWKVQEDPLDASSKSSISVQISKQRSGLLNEQPPFHRGTNPSDESLEEGPPRVSTDSQERPFEHWYRGDVSRNGGVGELRVGKRQEMLDIANYGHSLDPNKPVVRNAITDAIDNRRRRKRADSVGQPIERTSFYMDEEQAKKIGMVSDENPPTDVEEDDGAGYDSYYEYEHGEEEDENDETMDVDMSTASAPLPNSLDLRSTTPTPNYSRYQNSNSNTRIPAPSATSYQRGMSEPPSMPPSTASISTPPTSRSKQQAQLRSTSTSPSGRPGKRAVSPGVASTPSSSSAKKTRMNASKATQAKLAAQRKKEMEEEQARRKTSATYPDPGDEMDMAHAIPTWTQPVPKQGNWDDVVLPTVARKRGLADQYEHADGSPRVKQENSHPEPAPGTFGFDHSKYRPPRVGDEEIPMDEFGRPREDEIPENDSPAKPYGNDEFNTSLSQLQQQQQRRYRPEPPPSPVPFSQYHADQPAVPFQRTPAKAEEGRTQQEQQQQQQQQQELEEKEAGCCNVLSLLLSRVASSPTHFPPSSSNLNNLSFVINGTGAPGIFNSSNTPNEIYGIYNWCNMPHVRKREYKTPLKEFQLEYVEVIQRHHERTPYASNTFFKEDVSWDCTHAGQIHGGRGPSGASADLVQVQWNTFNDQSNPWTNSVGPGFVGSNCQFPAITPQGLEDSRTHGHDLREVYAPLLGLKSSFDPSQATIRVTNNVITSQVAAGLVKGLFPDTPLTSPAQVLIQTSGIDSLEPTYKCSPADDIRSAYTGSNANWTAHLTDASSLYDKLDKVSGIERDDSAGWHTSFDHYYDNLSAKLCHDKSLPCSTNDTSICVTQDEANTVFRLGNYEYSYYFRDAVNSTAYTALHFGAWFGELEARLQAQMDGSSKVKYYHNIGHDGSMASLLGFLQVDKMVWPGMGSEVAFELYKKQDGKYFVRVLWGGQPMNTSTPMGTLDMIPVETLLSCQYLHFVLGIRESEKLTFHNVTDIDSMIGSTSELFAACNT
ncbi:hypothetical protein V5O48_003819 [Marasmius crinis-equi]|uniref:Histidine acid phosphatase n=1 Tax=Marasmius crinis-equi TaxID=585013 RepID=A0ABR3FSA5_9AGAR